MKGILCALAILIFIVALAVMLIPGAQLLGAMLAILAIVLFAACVLALLAYMLGGGAITAYARLTEEDPPEWITELLRLARVMLDKLEEAIKKKWGNDRILKEICATLIEVLTIIRDHLNEIMELTDLGPLERRMLKAVLTRILNGALRRLREICKE